MVSPQSSVFSHQAAFDIPAYSVQFCFSSPDNHQPEIANHSYRSATMGSILVARRAGT
jgi:hypothetical protein